MILLLWYNIIIIRLLLFLLQPLLIGYGKKINKVLFPWPDTAYLSGPRIPIAAVYLSHAAGEGGRRTRTRAFSYRYGPPGSDRLNICTVAAIGADRPKVTCLEEKMRFHLDRDYLSLSLINSQHTMKYNNIKGRDEENERPRKK